MVQENSGKELIKDPIFIIGAPRSGTTLLYRTLFLHKDLWGLGNESHSILEGPLFPNLKEGESNRPNKIQMNDQTLHRNLIEKFKNNSINLEHWLNIFPKFRHYLYGADKIHQRILRKACIEIIRILSKIIKNKKSIRFLEKTPKNTLRVKFLDKLFPDAKFIWLTRDPISNIQSLIKGWNTFDSLGPLKIPRFNRFGYSLPEWYNIKDYKYNKWNFALIPEWEDLNNCYLDKVCCYQYFKCNNYAYRDFIDITKDRIFHVKFEKFLEEPTKLLSDIFDWAGLEYSKSNLSVQLPKVNTADNKKYPDKTTILKNIKDIEGFQEFIKQLDYEEVLNE